MNIDKFNLSNPATWRECWIVWGERYQVAEFCFRGMDYVGARDVWARLVTRQDGEETLHQYCNDTWIGHLQSMSSSGVFLTEGAAQNEVNVRKKRRQSEQESLELFIARELAE